MPPPIKVKYDYKKKNFVNINYYHIIIKLLCTTGFLNPVALMAETEEEKKFQWHLHNQAFFGNIVHH